MATENEKTTARLKKALKSAVISRESLVQATNEIAALAVVESEQFAPIGPTGQLRRGLGFSPARFSRGKASAGLFAAGARDENGMDYAEKIHNEKLRHVQGFSDPTKFDFGYQKFGEGNTVLERYKSGYQERRDSSGIFATRFFVHGVERAIKQAPKILSSIIRKQARGR